MRNICRHLRNSIAHCNFKTDADHNSSIKHITFKDFLDRKCKPEEQTFEAKISITVLRKFLIDFSTQTINKMKMVQTTKK